ncbi:DUF2868 domain-containing protein [Marinobacter sp. CHS3-4]|uniref:DUF2868 domain-containing protein n=1 Tax=Marinobacter sp. CHS3-4 TaxID=3045174 RepID=UPI0024B5A016|nr:DUF2868 domain-containing protein [Marinobacter sp. CHS3-4]MDI9243725.1 DUF2868 domain-containing protein [Marinobacter sp. CHS3-4]
MANSTLRRLLAFDRQIRRDRAQSPVFLHRRDRRFFLDCEARGQTPSTEHWLAHLERVGRPGAEASGNATSADQPLRRWQKLTAAFTLSGVVLGTITMAGLLYYDGGQRINLTLLLAFAALQCLLALITIGQSAVNWQPWRSLLKRVKLRDSDSPLKPLTPVLMARTAHVGGVCFGLASVATLLVLVVVEDLAFGWSTTLDTRGDSFHQLLSAIAWPWHTIWPAAVPDLSLVEATRFFRAGPDTSSVNPARWGDWWPFVLMTWLFYVVLPRLFGLVIAQVLLRVRAGRALANHPGMVALEYRMETPIVDTGNDQHDAANSPDEHIASQCQALPHSQILIYWAGANDPELPDSLSAGHLLTGAAGGQLSLAQDHQTIKRCADLLKQQERPAVTLVTRAWEPPIAELADFIQQAREDWPNNTRLAILPLAGDTAQLTTPNQLGQWLRFVERLKDDQICISQPDLSSPDSRAFEHQPEGLT